MSRYFLEPITHDEFVSDDESVKFAVGAQAIDPDAKPRLVYFKRGEEIPEGDRESERTAAVDTAEVAEILERPIGHLEKMRLIRQAVMPRTGPVERGRV